MQLRSRFLARLRFRAPWGFGLSCDRCPFISSSSRYRKLALKWHPDKNPENKEEAERTALREGTPEQEPKRPGAAPQDRKQRTCSPGPLSSRPQRLCWFILLTKLNLKPDGGESVKSPSQHRARWGGGRGIERKQPAQGPAREYHRW